MSKKKGPMLKFGEATGGVGFAAYETASLGDRRPARVVRELLQNSLDAAVDAGERTAIVRFRVTLIGRKSIPDIDGYEKAFRAAVKAQKSAGEIPDTAKQVVDDIERALERLRTEDHYALSVLDNGIGLDEKRMTSLLSDGTSTKSAEAAGSYGVGHLASIPTSDLRYVLYGGITTKRGRIASGCAVLASRPGRQKPLGAKGYLVEGFQNGDRGKFYRFMKVKSIPANVAADLERIKIEWGHGTAIIIPAFNYFGDEDDWWLWDIVSKVAAYNFSAAIHRGQLVIEVDEDALRNDDDKIGVQQLDQRNLGDLLAQESHNVRVAYKGNFFEGLRPSGANAYSAHQALLEPGHRVRTKCGELEVRYLVPAPTGNTRIDLYRNGMWITDDIYSLKPADFKDRQPFHAVLLLDANRGKQLHRLVRKAEGPMHDEVALNRLSGNERKQLKCALQEIATSIRSQIPEVSAKEYTPDDFLVVERGGDGASGAAKQFSMWGSPVVVQSARMAQRRPLPDGGHTESQPDASGRPGERERKRQPRRHSARRSTPLPFRSLVVPESTKRHVITLICDEALDEALLSICVDENVDATCDRVWPDEEVTLNSFKIEHDNTHSLECKLDRGNTALWLGGLAPGVTYKIVLEHECPDDLANAVSVPVFRVDLHRPTSPPAERTEDVDAS